MTGLIAALDTTDLVRARRWADAVAPHCGMIKLGLEFFMANGPAGVRAIDQRPIFLDLKLHDIPNTVAGAVRAILPLGPRFVTLHAAGGGPMLAAARAAAEEAGATRPKLLGVTVLTSIDTDALHATGIPGGMRDQVVRMARLALAAGADGVVCSAREVTALREVLGPEALLVVPGIRPAYMGPDDQARTMTPREAAAAGADWLVVGRPITATPDPGASAAAIAAEMAA